MANEPEGKEPFVPKADRPEVKIPEPETPVSQLTVRELQAILGSAPAKEREIKQIEKEFKGEVKNEVKEHKDQKNEVKEHKDQKNEVKDHKDQKNEVKEHKDQKN